MPCEVTTIVAPLTLTIDVDARAYGMVEIESGATHCWNSVVTRPSDQSRWRLSRNGSTAAATRAQPPAAWVTAWEVSSSIPA